MKTVVTSNFGPLQQYVELLSLSSAFAKVCVKYTGGLYSLKGKILPNRSLLRAEEKYLKRAGSAGLLYCVARTIFENCLYRVSDTDKEPEKCSVQKQIPITEVCFLGTHIGHSISSID